MAGIYLHIPFCRKACYYCDFHFSTNLSLRTDMVQAIARELEMQRTYISQPVETIYFGGGTPSLLDVAELRYLLETIHHLFDVVSGPEITLEANPDDLDLKIPLLREAGVNRLSIGIQSFNSHVLRFLNRSHDGPGAVEAVHRARHSGFRNISLDLIYAIPGQSDDEWKENIRTAVALAPEHISAYSLTIEENTVFGRWKAKGRFIPESDDHSARQLALLVEILDSNGYEQYEISNFAKPGYYSRHNSSYWRQQPYLGVGPSSHSYNGQTRQWNVSNNHEYLRKIAAGIVPSTIETLSKNDKINDYLLTTLRTSWGTDLGLLRRELGYDLMEKSGEYIQLLRNNGMATVEGEKLVLTTKGRFLADKISADLFAAES